jgi:hypothetical protein
MQNLFTGRIEDNEGGVATQLQGDFLDGGGALAVQQLPDAG